MSTPRLWTAAEDEAINTAKARGETLPNLALRLGISYATIKGRRGFLLRWGKDEARTKKRRVEVTCYCCRKKFVTSQLDVRKCQKCRDYGHDISCYDARF
jgi:hypothetical protein